MIVNNTIMLILGWVSCFHKIYLPIIINVVFNKETKFMWHLICYQRKTVNFRKFNLS